MSWTFSRSLAGIPVQVVCQEESLARRLDFDFDGFPPSDISGLIPAVKFHSRIAPYQPPSSLRESMRGRFGVCFDDGPVRHIRYPGPVWVRYDFTQDEGEVVGENADLVYERLYLSVLSRVGEKLEWKGLRRIHGLALCSPRGDYCLFLMRSGVGKSTLAHSLLQRSGWKLLSEDTPLLDSRGRLHPFPFRLALPPEPGERGKTLVRASQFAIAKEPGRCTHVFAGAWITGPQPAAAPLRKASLLGQAFRDGVIGLGVPQVSELFLRPGLRDALAKVVLAGGRLRSILPLMAARSHTLFLTPDGERNATFLEQWMGL
jgi:hypothetical protein